MGEEDLLYGDLDDSLGQCLSLRELVAFSVEHDLSDKEATIASLQQEIAGLKTALSNAQTNFRVLLNTARAEIERKDCIIHDLQQQLDATKMGSQ